MRALPNILLFSMILSASLLAKANTICNDGSGTVHISIANDHMRMTVAPDDEPAATYSLAMEDDNRTYNILGAVDLPEFKAIIRFPIDTHSDGSYTASVAMRGLFGALLCKDY